MKDDLEDSKHGGIDLSRVRSYLGRYRHITLVMLAHAFLTGICAQTLFSPCTMLPIAATVECSVVSDARTPLPLTIPEIRHLLGLLIWPAPGSVKLVLAWSWWLRCHRSCASYFHTKRRLEAGSGVLWRVLS